MNNLIAINDENINRAGKSVWWNRMNATLDVNTLLDVYDDSGLPNNLRPKPITPETALKRTLDQCFKNSKTLVRPIKGNGRGTYAIVSEASFVDETKNSEVSNVELQFTTGLKVSVVRDSAYLLNEKFTLRYDPEDHPGIDLIDSNFNANFHTWNGSDIGNWLISMATKYCHGVPLSDKGGFYYIPERQMPRWGEVLDVMGRVSQSVLRKINHMPTMAGDEAVDAVLSSLVLEAQKLISETEAKMLDEGLGTRGLSTRERMCSEFLEKMASYQTMLGNHMQSIQMRVAELRADVTAAKLMLVADAA